MDTEKEKRDMKLTFSKEAYAKHEKVMQAWVSDLDGAIIEFLDGQNWTTYHYGIHRVLIKKEWCVEGGNQ